MNNNTKNYAVILGARPNFVKAAAFFHEAKKHSEFNFILIHTGQHFDENMSKIFFEEMKIPRPDIYLDIQGEFHTEKIGKMFSSLKKVLSDKKLKGVIVFGDVNSTLAGSIASIKNNLKLIHIEAGLRSHDRRMPEEINRVIVDHLSDLLFTTEKSANENLIKEGIDEDKIKFVGNIMIESFEIFKDKVIKSDIKEKLSIKDNYIIATIHRQENTDDKSSLEKILLLLNYINKNIHIIFPLHPGTENKINSFNLSHLLNDFTIIKPLGYFEFMKLVMDSIGVITDSGGIQEETTNLGISCCTLRDNTERPITCDLGTNRLFSINSDPKDILEFINNRGIKKTEIPFWDNSVSERIFNFL